MCEGIQHERGPCFTAADLRDEELCHGHLWYDFWESKGNKMERRTWVFCVLDCFLGRGIFVEPPPVALKTEL